MMNEKQAWQMLAKLWSEPLILLGTVRVVVCGDCHGLCDCINDFYNKEEISYRTRCKMLIKIRDVNPHHGWYMWPFTKNGAKERVKFCKRMLKNLNRKKRK